MQGIKHVIECHCMLPQYRNRPDPVFHKFIAFSVMDDSDTVVPKYMQCNNCGIVHKIIDLCKSEIITGKEELKSLITIDEIKLSLPDDLINILEIYDADLPTWEHVHYILQQQQWGSQIVLTRDVLKEEIQGKLLSFTKEGKFKIESFINHLTVE